MAPGETFASLQVDMQMSGEGGAHGRAGRQELEVVHAIDSSIYWKLHVVT
jgi:hypothetical protein